MSAEEMLEILLEMERMHQEKQNTLPRKCLRWSGAIGKLPLAMVLSLLFSVFPKRGEFNPEGDDEGAGNSSDGTNDGRKAGKLVSPFETLGLKEEDNPAEKDINKAFKQLALKWHPDKNKNSEESVNMMQRLNEAKVLCLEKVNGGRSVDEGRYDSEDGGDDREPKRSPSGKPGKGKASAEAKERKAAERAYFAAMRKAQEEYRQRRKDEKKKIKSEMKHPGRRFFKETVARDAVNATIKPTPIKRTGKASAPKVELNEPEPLKQMDTCTHEVAVAVRAGASCILSELLQMRYPPLSHIDENENTALHYVARYSPEMANTMLSILGEDWQPAMMMKNKDGKFPVNLLKLRSAGDAQGSRIKDEKELNMAKLGATRLKQLHESSLTAEKKIEKLNARVVDPSALLSASLACVAGATVYSSTGGGLSLLSIFLSFITVFIAFNIFGFVSPCLKQERNEYNARGLNRATVLVASLACGAGATVYSGMGGELSLLSIFFCFVTVFLVWNMVRLVQGGVCKKSQNA